MLSLRRGNPFGNPISKFQNSVIAWKQVLPSYITGSNFRLKESDKPNPHQLLKFFFSNGSLFFHKFFMEVNSKDRERSVIDYFLSNAAQEKMG